MWKILQYTQKIDVSTFLKVSPPRCIIFHLVVYIMCTDFPSQLLNDKIFINFSHVLYCFEECKVLPKAEFETSACVWHHNNYHYMTFHQFCLISYLQLLLLCKHKTLQGFVIYFFQIPEIELEAIATKTSVLYETFTTFFNIIFIMVTKVFIHWVWIYII